MFYHGTTTAANIGHKLLPPNTTNVIGEKGRKKNLDRVFFTKDIGLARIYAGRAVRSYGGDPVLLRVVSPADVVCMNETKGASVYHASGAFCEILGGTI
ncbi:hypothetical protein VPDG_00150 [Vibrio phage henriette 12B8]|uniref:hypothetical protein n=1 Tax=Vibrio phage henriette 12B8 TaxID=573174 RepID=UPI0002C077AB|nr:hypothetical protein VPDG_00150 [Vibrio phage henriette 12B8]AGG58311.1 hypothetical protein VPDG_00150 [Vibrio phage henriette 12B8]